MTFATLDLATNARCSAVTSPVVDRLAKIGHTMGSKPGQGACPGYSVCWVTGSQPPLPIAGWVAATVVNNVDHVDLKTPCS